MNWENVAHAGYEKFRETMTAQYQSQDVAETWDRLQEQEKRAWIEAAKEICDIQTRVALA